VGGIAQAPGNGGGAAFGYALPVRTSSAATDALEESVSKGDVTGALAAAEALGREGILSGASALERAADAFPEEPRFAMRALHLLLRSRDWARFDARLATTAQRFPDSVDLHALRGRAEEERGRACAALRAYGRVVRLDRDDLETVIRMARIFRENKRPFLARRGLRRALVRHPDAAGLHGAMGFSYVQDGQFGKAVRSFRRADELESDDAPWAEHLGGALLLLERWHDAAATAVKILQARRGTERTWTVFAVAHRHLGRQDLAEKGYRTALKCANDPSRARGNLGLFLASHGGDGKRGDEAIEHLRAALDAHPDWVEVEDALTRLLSPPEA
jgi:Tfp pilus assembly protein PilF